jgi:hypothetical protein
MYGGVEVAVLTSALDVSEWSVSSSVEDWKDAMRTEH